VTTVTQQPDARPLVLLVEDEDGARRSLQLFLLGRGYRVRAHSAAAAALADPSCAEAPLLVADYRLPDSDGLRLLAAMRQRGWKGRAILVTGHGSKPLADAARAAGFAAILEKPLRHHQLLLVLEGAGH
jgi:FixJ family two-component response regulator